jgi:hypothetical protein
MRGSTTHRRTVAGPTARSSPEQRPSRWPCSCPDRSFRAGVRATSIRWPPGRAASCPVLPPAAVPRRRRRRRRGQ